VKDELIMNELIMDVETIVATKRETPREAGESGEWNEPAVTKTKAEAPTEC
jgi:hypothetical protein